MKKKGNQRTFLSITVLLSVCGIVLAFYLTHQPPREKVIAIPSVPTAKAESLVPLVPNSQTNVQISPDGTKQLTLTSTTNNDLSKSYVLKTSDVDGSNQKTIYTLQNTTDSVTVPFNTWSPDNAYVFFLDKNVKSNDAIVANANDEPISSSDMTENVTALFLAKNTQDRYAATTGWASSTLLIITTQDQSGSEGTSYWFEVPTKAIIPLSTKF